MNRKKKIAIGLISLLFMLLILVGMYFFSGRDNKKDADVVPTEAVRFAKEYEEVQEENVFVYRDIQEIQKIFENGTGIVYLGFPECPWCQRYVRYLNEVAKEKGVEKIYYFNVKKDRADNTEDYQHLVTKLGKNLSSDDEGNPRIYVPDVSFIVSGEVVGHDNETSMSSGSVDEYWTEEKVAKLKGRLRVFIDNLDLANCSTCK